MKILLLNQTFHPDVVSTAQHLTDLAVALSEAGHEVTVLCGRRAYDTAGKSFPRTERWNDIQIHRVGSLGLGKSAKWRRAADFASFFLTATFKALTLPKQDAVVALTSPPLISALGAWLARRWGGSFHYWIMDLNPDEAIAAGWLRPDSLAAKTLDKISRFSLRRSQNVIVLDRFMQERITAKGIDPSKITVLPPWSHDDEVRFDPVGRERFRRAHGLDDKFVVMYSGNHSPCHPLDTVLEAAKQMDSTGVAPKDSELKTQNSPLAPSPGSTGVPPVPFGASPKDSILDPPSSILFCFIGGGSEFARVQRFAGAHQLKNILCLPYQPLDQLAGSLSAADLHLVVMGKPFLGTIHPCKIYNILLIASPVLFIGPRPSHVSEILETLDAACHGFTRPGEAGAVVEQIQRFQEREKTGRNPERFEAVAARFSKHTLVPKLVELVTK